MRLRHAVLCSAALVATACGGEAAATVPEPEMRPFATEAGAPPMSADAGDASQTAGVLAAGTGSPEGAVPVTTTATVARPATVAIVGDSLTVQAEQAIRAALAPTGLQIVGFDAVEGRRTAARVGPKTSGAEAVATILTAAEPELWVVALGTNDVPGVSTNGFREHAERLLAEIPADAPVIWFDTWIKSRIDECRRVNDVLREIAAVRPGMTVVDWFQFGDDPGIIQSDGIHLTEVGRAKFADQFAKAYAARFG